MLTLEKWFRNTPVNAQVLCAANFDGDGLIKVDTDALLEAGLHIGMKVYNTIRVSMPFGPTKFRKDVNVGTHAFIIGVSPCKKQAVVTFKATIGKTEYYSDCALKFRNLAKVDGAIVAAVGAKGGKSTPSGIKGFEFVLKKLVGVLRRMSR